MADVPAGTRWLGTPAMPVREFMKGHTILRKLARRGGKAEGEDR
jgi:UDP-3-O-[3-hydroxymyristoyl] glucosamine N-acyltransferase